MSEYEEDDDRGYVSDDHDMNETRKEIVEEAEKDMEDFERTKDSGWYED